VGVVTEVEQRLAELRRAQAADDVADLRTSTMTHVVWAPRPWLPRARRVLAGLSERHPARTIFLVPETGADAVRTRVSVRDFPIDGGREVLSEVVEVHLHGRAADHPGSIVLPLLISDLPAFCRWRGEPDWHGSALAEITTVVDRLVVDSSEWRSPAHGNARLAGLFERVAVSDLAWRRTLPWRGRLAEQWPSIRRLERVRVAGPRADALLLAGWLRSRLRRELRLTVTAAERVSGVWLDGVPVEAPFVARSTGSDLLSAELDSLARDPIYEAALRAS
jgi:glucose-6-phosphate dehydrogenase assembly protein OpcA